MCDTAARAQLLIDIRSQATSLRTIIMIEEVKKDMRQVAQVAGIKLLHFDEVEVRTCLF